MDIIFDPSLVLYLPLYKLDGASFRSGDARGHLCTVTGTVWTHHGGNFDGVDDKVNIAQSSVLNPDAITILAWIKSDLIPASDCEVIEGRSGGGNYRLFVLYSSGKIACYLSGLSSSGWHMGNTVLAAETYYHAAFTYSSSTGKVNMYVNGLLDHTVTTTGSLATISADDYVGWQAGESNRAFDGTIAEVVMYNRDLGALEVQNSYYATKWRYQ